MLKRCREGGTIQGKVTQLEGGVRRVGARLVTLHAGRQANGRTGERVEIELAKVKKDLDVMRSRMREHEDACDTCREVRVINEEMREQTKTRARVSDMLYRGTGEA